MVEVMGEGSLGILLLPDVSGRTAMIQSYAGRLTDQGFTVAIAGDWVGADDLEIPDRLGLAAARAGRDALAGRARRIAVLGFGVGGLFARLAVSALTGFSAAVDFGGRLVYPTISPQKPAQPLDLLPGMNAALQCHYGEEARLNTEQQIAELQRRMESRGLPFQLFLYPGVGSGFYDPLHPGYDLEAAELAWHRSVRFLEHLEDSG